jgi:hypothetical protein
MTPSKDIEPWRRFDRLGPALLTFLVLGIIDFALQSLGTGETAPILNAAAIGVLGGAAVYFYLTASRASYYFGHVKERMTLIGELNERIRNAMVRFAASALSEDPTARLRAIDEATDHIDSILSDFLTTPRSGRSVKQQLRTPTNPEHHAEVYKNR